MTQTRDEQTLGGCQDDLYENGKIVFVIKEWEAHAIENWVKEVARRSGQRVDWHYSGYSANVVGLGDFDKISRAIVEMLPELNKGIREYMSSKCSNFGFFQPFKYSESEVNYWNEKPIVKNNFMF